MGKHENKLGLRGIDLAELIFEDARVPKENLVGQRGKGWDMLMTTAADFRAYGPGAMAVGLAQGALDYAVAYAKERYSLVSQSLTTRPFGLCWPICVSK